MDWIQAFEHRRGGPVSCLKPRRTHPHEKNCPQENKLKFSLILFVQCTEPARDLQGCVFGTVGALTVSNSTVEGRPIPRRKWGSTVFFKAYHRRCCPVVSHMSQRGHRPG